MLPQNNMNTFLSEFRDTCNTFAQSQFQRDKSTAFD